MRAFIIILFFFIEQPIQSQTIIKLTSPLSARDDYHLVDNSDTTLIEIGHQVDMGVWYLQYYKLKDSLPSGRYYVFVNDTLKQEGSFKNGLRDSTWIDYYESGREITPYINGQANGYYKVIRTDGSLETIAKCGNGVMPVRTHFYKNEKVRMREYFIWTALMGGTHCRVEYFDENGNLERVDTRMMQTGTANFKKGKLDGESTLIYKGGHFNLVFEDNKLVSWKYFNSKGEELLSDTNLPY